MIPTIPVILAICALFPGYYGITHHILVLTYMSVAAAAIFLLIGTFAAMGRNRR
jgi:hypothetical protein